MLVTIVFFCALYLTISNWNDALSFMQSIPNSFGIGKMPLVRGSCATREKQKCSECMRPYTMVDRIPNQVRHANRLVGVINIDCMLNLQMDRNSFGRLCQLLKQRGVLTDVKYISVE